MTQRYETHYKLEEQTARLTARLNENSEDMDRRIDALEGHAASHQNVHFLTAEDVGAAVAAHTHQIQEHFSIVVAGGVSEGPQPGKPTIREARTLRLLVAAVDTPSSDGDIIVDIQKSGDYGATWTSMMTTKLRVPEGAYSSIQSQTQPLMVSGALNANDRLRVAVDAAGVGAEELCVTGLLSKSVGVE